MIKLIPFADKNLERAYLSFKDTLYDVSVAAFGWEEKFQHERFLKAYKPEWFYWIEYQSKQVGYICYSINQTDLHIHLLIIDKEFQSAGYGKEAMILIDDIAKKNNLDITLSTLKNNTGAVKFYQRIGYQIASQDEYFYDLILKKS